MGLEVANFISDLNVAWPKGTDKRREGDDHIRLVKKTLTNTLPNLDAETTVTPTQLNSLAALEGAGIGVGILEIVTELLLHVNKKGTIIMWDILNAAIPTGWVICDGATVAGYGDVPNMIDRFVICAGGTYAAGDLDGDFTTELGGAHTPVVEGHSLTAAENGPHTHPAALVGFPAGAANIGGLTFRTDIVATTTGSSGSGDPHTHPATAVPGHTHEAIPPLYAAVFIVKVVDYVPPT